MPSQAFLVLEKAYAQGKLGAAFMIIPPSSVLISAIRNNSFLFKPNAQIVFVCGRALTSSGSKRKIFLEYAQKHIPDVHLLLAEDIIDLQSDCNDDLLTIEKNMSSYSDCIMIILESESAFCELGAFAVEDTNSKKMLIVNDISHIASRSFISKGPLAKIEAMKNSFAGVEYVNLESILSCVDRLACKFSKLKKNKAKRIKFHDFIAFKEMKKERLLFLCDIINLLSPITYREIIALFIILYGKNDYHFLSFDLKILQALQMVRYKKIDNTAFYTRAVVGMKFLKIEFSAELQIRSSMFLTYRKQDPNRLKFLGEIQ